MNILKVLLIRIFKFICIECQIYEFTFKLSRKIDAKPSFLRVGTIPVISEKFLYFFTSSVFQKTQEQECFSSGLYFVNLHEEKR